MPVPKLTNNLSFLIPADYNGKITKFIWYWQICAFCNYKSLGCTLNRPSTVPPTSLRLTFLDLLIKGGLPHGSGVCTAGRKYTGSPPHRAWQLTTCVCRHSYITVHTVVLLYGGAYSRIRLLPGLPPSSIHLFRNWFLFHLFHDLHVFHDLYRNCYRSITSLFSINVSCLLVHVRELYSVP